MTQKKYPVSVFIIAKNEADRIGRSIISTRDWADEVIVIDSGSEDDTVAVSEKLGARVLYNPWKGYGAQKIFGEKLCRNKWIINIDADEEISKELAEEIKGMFEKGGEPTLKAYHITITIVHRFDSKAHKWAPSNAPIRLFHRDYASFDSEINGLYHDSVIPKADKLKPENIGHLQHIILHRSIRSISHSMEKANFLTGMQAREMFEKGKKPSVVRLIFEPFTAFIKAYLLRRYFIYGLNGFVDSVLFAASRFMRIAKAREYFQEEAFRKHNGV